MRKYLIGLGLLVGVSILIAVVTLRSEPRRLELSKLEMELSKLEIKRPWPEGLIEVSPRTRDGQADPADDQPSDWLAKWEGTEIEFLLTDPGRTITGYDKGACKLIMATDDRGTNLLEDVPAEPAAPSGFLGGLSRGLLAPLNTDSSERPEARLSGDLHPGGHALRLSTTLKRAPAADWCEIRIRGQIVLHQGSDEKTLEQSNADLREGKLVLGTASVQFRRSERSDPGAERTTGTSLELQTRQSFDVIKSLEFLDPRGQVIPYEETGTSWGSFNDQTSYSQTLQLQGNVDRATIKVRYYNRVETVTVPIDQVISCSL